MGKMRFGIAHRILHGAQAAEQKLKELNRQLERGTLIGDNLEIQDYLESANKLNSDVMEEMAVHIEKLHTVVNEARWWHRQIAKSLLMDISKEIQKFLEIMVKHNYERIILSSPM